MNIDYITDAKQQFIESRDLFSHFREKVVSVVDLEVLSSVLYWNGGIPDFRRCKEVLHKEKEKIWVRLRGILALPLQV